MPTRRLWGSIVFVAAIGCCAAQAQTPIPPAPQDYALAATQSDQYEILAAQVAEAEAQDPRVRAFAEMMIGDHTRMSGDLRQAAMASGLPAPRPSMSSDEAALLAALQGLRGTAFDQAYARQQVLAHTQAAAVAESFAAAGADPMLQKAAQTELPIIKDHLQKAQQLRAELGGS